MILDKREREREAELMVYDREMCMMRKIKREACASLAIRQIDRSLIVRTACMIYMGEMMIKSNVKQARDGGTCVSLYSIDRSDQMTDRLTYL